MITVRHMVSGRIIVGKWALLLITALTAFAPGVCGGSLSWRWSNPMPLGNNCYDLAATNGFAVLVGDRGQVYTSMDYEFWIPRESHTRRALRAVAFFGDRVVITGEQGIILHARLAALDQIEVVDLGTEDWLEGLAIGGGVAVAVGDNGAIYTSTNPASWARRPQSFNGWLRSVAYGAGTFVAVGESGFVGTSANGVTWTQRNSGTTVDLNRVVWLTNRFVAVGNRGVILASADGTAWSSVTGSGTTNDLWIAAGYYPVSSLVSPLLMVGGDNDLRLLANWAWSDQTVAVRDFPAPEWSYYSAFWDGSIFLVGGSAGLLLEGFKPNPTTDWVWVERNDALRPWLWDIGRIGSQYVAVGNYGTIMTSSDGAGWNLELAPTGAVDKVLLGVGGRSGLVVAVGTGGTILTSENGVTWSLVTPPPVTNDLQGITYWQGRFFSTGGGGSVLSSSNGNSWTVRTNLGATFLSSIAGSAGRLVVVGQRGAMFTSADGEMWQPVHTGTTNWLYRVRAFEAGWVAVGQNGALLISTDGEHWESQASGTESWLNDVCEFNGRWYAVGNQGTVLASGDMRDWENEGTVTQKSLYGAVSDAHQLVTVGVEGVILRGQAGPLTILDYRRIGRTNALALSGPPGRSVTIQSSEDIGAWTNLAALEFLDDNGLLLFLDNGSNTSPRLIFRGALQ